MSDLVEPTMDKLCKHCGGEIAARNPTRTCDHLYWPDMLTREAKIANGFRPLMVEQWVHDPDYDAGFCEAANAALDKF